MDEDYFGLFVREDVSYAVEDRVDIILEQKEKNVSIKA